MNEVPPLVNRYFGKYMKQLLDGKHKGRFIDYFHSPSELEERLGRIESLKLTQTIIDEVGNISDLDKLNDRLQNAWAEIRTLDQLVKEKFVNLEKVIAIADFTGKRESRDYAFQVTRINKSLEDDMRHNKEDKRNSSPFGTADDIYSRIKHPISTLFWNALESKNTDFKKWEELDFIRCLVIVSSDKILTDPVVRHIACQQIKQNIVQYLLPLNFEELIWLPDISNGARFTIESSLKEIRCFVDWQDEPHNPFDEDKIVGTNLVSRREIDLNNDY